MKLFKLSLLMVSACSIPLLRAATHPDFVTFQEVLYKYVKSQAPADRDRMVALYKELNKDTLRPEWAKMARAEAEVNKIDIVALAAAAAPRRGQVAQAASPSGAVMPPAVSATGVPGSASTASSTPVVPQAPALGAYGQPARGGVAIPANIAARKKEYEDIKSQYEALSQEGIAPSAELLNKMSTVMQKFSPSDARYQALHHIIEAESAQARAAIPLPEASAEDEAFLQGAEEIPAAPGAPTGSYAPSGASTIPARPEKPVLSKVVDSDSDLDFWFKKIEDYLQNPMAATSVTNLDVAAYIKQADAKLKTLAKSLTTRAQNYYLPKLKQLQEQLVQAAKPSAPIAAPAGDVPVAPPLTGSYAPKGKAALEVPQGAANRLRYSSNKEAVRDINDSVTAIDNELATSRMNRLTESSAIGRIQSLMQRVKDALNTLQVGSPDLSFAERAKIEKSLADFKLKLEQRIKAGGLPSIDEQAKALQDEIKAAYAISSELSSELVERAGNFFKANYRAIKDLNLKNALRGYLVGQVNDLPR